jgi:outer membrane lipoprotein-sorting protein
LAITSVVLATAVAVPMIADADAELPERSAGELLVELVDSGDVPFAGTIVHSADVGIPELPGTTGAGSSPLALLSGATSARIWYADESTYRLALYGDLAETDLIRDGQDVWYWNSDQNVVMHQTVDQLEEAKEQHPDRKPMAELPTDVLAELALRFVEPSTEIEVEGTATVAGRAAYELVVSPKDDRSLIGSVRVAVDGEHGVPLRVQIFSAEGGDPAVEVGFTSVSFDEPDRSVFEFTPPPGAVVEEFDVGWLAAPESEPVDTDLDVELIEDQWMSVLVVSGFDLDMLTAHVDELANVTDEFGDLSGLVDSFMSEMRPVSGPYGTGLGFESRLFSALWLDDGRLLIGAVGLDVLEEKAM